MDARRQLAREFGAHRPKMTAVAARLLGSASQAEDAVQEAWLRLDRTDAQVIENLQAWLMTTVTRIALNMLRSRSTRREMPLDHEPPPHTVDDRSLPEVEVLLADAVGTALHVVVDTLTPAERVAYVMHEAFGFSFGEIGRILDRSPQAARQLASRARRRVRTLDLHDDDKGTDLGVADQRVVRAFLTAAREGDFDALLAVLDPHVVERVAQSDGQVIVVHDAHRVAARAAEFAMPGVEMRPGWVDGWPGWIAYHEGVILSLGAFDITDGRVVRMDVITHPGKHLRIRATGE